MQKAKVTIKIEMFDDAAVAKFAGYEPIICHSDSGDVSSALISALLETLTTLELNGHKFSPRLHQSTADIKARKDRKLFMYQDKFEENSKDEK